MEIVYAEAAAHNATLIPFLVSGPAHGAFYPLDTSHVHGGYNPAATHKTIFGTNGPPRRGKVALAVVGGMIRNIANRVTSDGIRAFDVELGDFQAVGQIIDRVYKSIVYESIIGTARAAIALQ